MWYHAAGQAKAQHPRTRLYRRLALMTLLITLCLLMLGAWVRLTDAGLGCPDWPGCYGHLTPEHAKDKISAAVQAQGGEHGPVSLQKAWNEMVHRYVASFVGLLILMLAGLGWTWRKDLPAPPWLSFALVGVVILQGFFGKWTVTLLLKPAIVTGHLIGGMLVFSLLVLLWQRQRAPRHYVDAEPVARLQVPALIGLVMLAMQIFLGGWTSTNYAALACTDLPTCQGQWWPAMEFGHAFHLFRELGQTADGANLSAQALTAIHLTHRIWAVIVAAYLLWLAARTIASGSRLWDNDGRAGERFIGYALAAMVVVQVILGLSNVYWSLPIQVAVAHNGGAAVLLGLMVVLCLRARRARLMI